ncbi:MAG TPA: calcium-binding protein [Thermoleophilaceae bacterium]|nr:calcium-binding protein [Thermoleophilaceae bacterium]
MTRTGLLAAAAVVGALMLLPASAGAVGRVPHFEKCSPDCDILVNSSKDLPDVKPGDGRCRASTGRCTLRAAVQEANARALAKPWRVLVPGGHYTLTRHGLDDDASHGDLDLDFNGEVVGAGASKTAIDGDGQDRVFDMLGREQRVAHLTVTDGVAFDGPGGGIRTRGSGRTYVQYVYVGGNEAAATEAPLSGYGGGLAAIGAPVVSDSTFEFNEAVNGAGLLWAAHEAGLNYSAVIHNHASNDGGGVYLTSENSDFGNDTISGNSAGQHGGGIFFATTANWLNMFELTIASNSAATGLGGGVWREPNPHVEETPRRVSGTIVARNGAGHDCAGPGELVSGGGNLDSDESCGFGAETDQSGLDPLLGPLGDHGGPTPTRELLTDSPAIDAFPCANEGSQPLLDQRGAERPFGLACDSGAFEVGSCCVPEEKPFLHHERPPPVSYCGLILRGTNGPDVLRGTRSRNDIHGRSGNDRIFGRFQADCLHGGRGDDYIRGGNGTDALQGDSGDDILIGGDQEDTILGETGADRLLGGADDDKLYGGPGPDFIRGGDGYDVISAGPGNDTIDATRGGLDRVDCGSGNDTIRAKRLEHLYGCEHVHYVD